MLGGDLDEGVSGVLDAAGACTLSLSPKTQRQRWKIANVAISGDDVTDLDAVVLVAGRRVAGTFSGVNDNVPMAVTLTPGQTITVQWSGGTPGAGVRMDLVGSYDVAAGGGEMP